MAKPTADCLAISRASACFLTCSANRARSTRRCAAPWPGPPRGPAPAGAACRAHGSTPRSGPGGWRLGKAAGTPGSGHLGFLADRLVGRFQPLDPGLGVASGRFQIVGRILQLPLVQLQLRLGHVQLVLQPVLLGLRGGGQLPGQVLDELLVALHGGRSLVLQLGEGRELGRQGGGVLGDPAQGLREGEVHGVVAQAHRLFREGLLFRPDGQPSQRPGRQERLHVHQALLLRLRVLLRPGSAGGLPARSTPDPQRTPPAAAPADLP